MTGVATPGVDCFDELMALPDKIKEMTPIKIYRMFTVVGPYIGTKIEGEFAVECLKCISTVYGNNVEGTSCDELTMEKEYNYVIMTGVATPGVDCFDELMALPDKIKEMTPIKIYRMYTVVGPYIGKSKSFRVVQVVEDELENRELGTKIVGEFAVECLECISTVYGNNVEGTSCDELTMEECPERISKELYWNPRGNITASSDAEFCVYRKENGKHEYICTIFEADLDVES
ncbi:uncharacterized protein [Ptychodera flava]|uniref:uncharacterized protein n=1 Tax=Ptychodera flava TaxID=63121 RepID=UPI00396A6F5C